MWRFGNLLGAIGLGRFDALAVDHDRTGIRHVLLLHPVIPPERCVQIAPRAVKAPLAKVIVDAV